VNDVREKLNQQKVLVTGASGFIGRRLVKALANAGAEVTALSRTRSGAAELGGSSVKTVIASLNRPSDLPEILLGQDVVFHLAYDVRAPAAENLSAFENLYEAAIKSGVGRFVHTSSIVVYDGWPDQDIDENSPVDRPGGSPYRRAKIEMERKLMNGPLPAAILQPTIVYGPGSAQWTDALASNIASGGIVLPTPICECNGVFVDDVVQALLRAAALPDLDRERFIISGPSTFSWAQLLEGYARIVETGKVEYRPLEELIDRIGPKPDESADNDAPSTMAKISAIGRRVLGRERFENLVRLARQRLAKDGLTYPGHHLLEEFSSTGTCRIDHARKRLGYRPEFDLENGLAATEQHIRSLLGRD